MRTGVALLLAALGWIPPVSGADPPFIALPRVAARPGIDGLAAPGEWSQAAVTGGFRNNGTGRPAAASVVVSVGYDDTALYCLFRCSGEAPGQLKGGAAERDSGIWGGSLVEVFLTPQDWPQTRYAHFGVNHAGTVADEMCDQGHHDASWNPEWQCAVGQVGEAWLAEMAIPWASLGLNKPRDGQAFRVNLTRNAASIGELSTWAPVRGGFHHPEQFGTLTLAGDSAAAAIEGLPGRIVGPVSLQARLIGDEAGGKLTAVVSGTGPRLRRVYSERLVEVGTARTGGHLRFDIPDGASLLAVFVHDATGDLLWRQTVELHLPALGVRVRRLRDVLERLQRAGADLGSASGGAGPELAGLEERLAGLAAEADGPLDGEGLSRVEEAIEGLGRRITDLAMLAQARREATGEGHGGGHASYFVTNPVCTQKTQPTAAQPGPLAAELRIAAARGEYEPVQIVVCAVAEDLTRVRVSAGRLTGPAGSAIPADRVVVNPVGFVHCRMSTQGARLTGEVPDVLLPDRAVDVEAGRRQPFFITVQTTPQDVPGEYRGHLWIRARNAAATCLPLVLRVYEVALPAKSHLRTAFVLWNGGVQAFADTTGSDSFTGAYIRYSKVMLAHRISPITMWRIQKGEGGEWDFADVDRYLSALAPLGLTTFNIGANGSMAKQRDVEAARAAAEHLRERGWWDLHYVYGRDEAPEGAQDELCAAYAPLVQAVPDIKIMQTGWSPSEALRGLVRIWCPLTARADMAAVRAAQGEGDEVWWYVCCGPIAPYANLFVDYPGIDHRILGWMTYRSGVEGFLYWGVNVWSHNPPPVGQYDRANYANWNPNSYSTINGDGYLLYPGRDGTAVPSLRLALLRDGFEDYDLFTEVGALAEEVGGPLAERARHLLAFEAPLISDLSDYTQDGADLLARREEILRVGERLARHRR